LGRFFLESMRQSEYILYIKEPVGISHVVSLAAVISAAVVMYRLRRKKA
jgi:prolipoprotein diacylglyceryltransferase